MKKYILPIFCAFLLGSCSGGTTDIESTQGFHLSYPSSYSAGSDTANGVALRDKTTSVIIVAKKTPITQDSQKTNEAVTEWYKKNSTLDSNGTIKFAGKDGGYVEWTNKVGTFSYIHKDSWAIIGDSLYSVSCTIPEKSKDTGKTDCDSVIASFGLR